MALTPGTRLGPYEIAAQIGEGGMGTVYRARDTRLDRDVAIKVLPEVVAQDAERLARFDREAKTLAALNHPNIAQIHGLEESDGTKALVMELVEGPTLADRIAQGPLPVDEALPIAKQIAEALEAAHAQGIIHRDLKPANIKVRSDGTVKVLDFGLAKAIAPATGALSSASPSVSMSPTITTPAMTQAGLILGTAAYMSPEQIRGRPVDKRSDIWAFGCVLYEMLTGTRAFAAEDVSLTLAKVLEQEFSDTSLPGHLPLRLRQLIRLCLVKNSRQRLADAQDVRLILEGAFGADGAQATVRSRVALKMAVLWASGAAVGLLLAFGLMRPATDLAPAPLVERFAIASDMLEVGAGTRVAVSPDGSTIVFVGIEDGTRRLYRRVEGQLDVAPIEGSAGVVDMPFFSPDGRWVGFSDGNSLRKVPLVGGTAMLICRGPGVTLRGADWGRDDAIVFGSTNGLWRVSADGGAPELLLGDGEAIFSPRWVDDSAVVYESRQGAERRIVRAELEGQGRSVVTEGQDPRVVSSGYLVYARAGALWAARFDGRRLVGDAVQIVDGIAQRPNTAYQYDAVDGTLVYVPDSSVAIRSVLAWVDREGQPTGLVGREGVYRAPRVSPEGDVIAVGLAGDDGNEDIWIFDATRDTQARLTTEPGTDAFPEWTPDGSRLVFSSNRDGGVNSLYWMAADRSDQPERLTRATSNQGATSWTPDGEILAYYQTGGATTGAYDVFTLRPGGAPVPLLSTPFVERGAAFSPDGRWVAYSSDESGRDEIYVAPVSGRGARVTISTSGGRSPIWSASGRELFYREGSQVLAVTIQPGDIFSADTPRVLFAGPYVQEVPNQGSANYDVTPDGQRFLMLLPVEAEDDVRPQVVVATNWQVDLGRGEPAN